MTNFCLKASGCHDCFLFLTLLYFLMSLLNQSIYGFGVLSFGNCMFSALVVEILQELHPFIEQMMPISLPCICTEGRSTDSWTASLFCAPLAWLWFSKTLCSSGLKIYKRQGVCPPSVGSSTPTLGSLFWGTCSGEVLWCNFGFLEASSSLSSSLCGSQNSAQCSCRAEPKKKGLIQTKLLSEKQWGKIAGLCLPYIHRIGNVTKYLCCHLHSVQNPKKY